MKVEKGPKFFAGQFFFSNVDFAYTGFFAYNAAHIFSRVQHDFCWRDLHLESI